MSGAYPELQSDRRDSTPGGVGIKVRAAEIGPSTMQRVPEMPEPSATSNSASAARGPTLAAHIAFVPCGLVTVLLGPLLPSLATRWNLSDTQSGDLFFAQFLASSIGVLISGALVPRRGYRFAILLGLAF